MRMEPSSLRPASGLIVSGWVIDMLFHNRYILMPINSALSSARIDFTYTGGSSVKVKFRPRHALFANSDSLEEGVRQLINNYTHYVYSTLDDYLKIVFRTMAMVATGTYYEFLQAEVATNPIGKGKERWSLAFAAFGGLLVRDLSAMYYVPEGGAKSRRRRLGQEADRSPLRATLRAYHGARSGTHSIRSVLTTIGNSRSTRVNSGSLQGGQPVGRVVVYGGKKPSDRRRRREVGRSSTIGSGMCHASPQSITQAVLSWRCPGRLRS